MAPDIKWLVERLNASQHLKCLRTRMRRSVCITPNPEHYDKSITTEYYATTSGMHEYYATTSGMADYYAAATADELCTSRAVFEFSDYEADCYIYMDGIMMDSAAARGTAKHNEVGRVKGLPLRHI